MAAAMVAVAADNGTSLDPMPPSNPIHPQATVGSSRSSSTTRQCTKACPPIPASTSLTTAAVAGNPHWMTWDLPDEEAEVGVLSSILKEGAH